MPKNSKEEGLLIPVEMRLQENQEGDPLEGGRGTVYPVRPGKRKPPGIRQKGLWQIRGVEKNPYQ